ncbi:hypothetical protein Sjap_000369 [Stephania japonica]|uniref:Uncharacterized protein n=1 Tax=Stephania japonica TaxID=461633 RepID=A0AAP0PSE5_9MAGN
MTPPSRCPLSVSRSPLSQDLSVSRDLLTLSSLSRPLSVSHSPLCAHAHDLSLPDLLSRLSAFLRFRVHDLALDLSLPIEISLAQPHQIALGFDISAFALWRFTSGGFVRQIPILMYGILSISSIPSTFDLCCHCSVNRGEWRNRECAEIFDQVLVLPLSSFDL